ncbi:hypothetical protein TNCV_1666981 [Trichonephila clavipes]|nr:hypothetical protein TNCV_1666981 [Trichonephila clavipes]
MSCKRIERFNAHRVSIKLWYMRRYGMIKHKLCAVRRRHSSSIASAILIHRYLLQKPHGQSSEEADLEPSSHDRGAFLLLGGNSTPSHGTHQKLGWYIQSAC